MKILCVLSGLKGYGRRNTHSFLGQTTWRLGIIMLNEKVPEIWGEETITRLIIKADNPLYVPSGSITVTGVSIVFDDVRSQSASHQERTSKITASLFSPLFVVQLLLLLVAWSLQRPVWFPMQGSGLLTGPVAHFKHRPAGQKNSPPSTNLLLIRISLSLSSFSLGTNKWCMFWGNVREICSFVCVWDSWVFISKPACGRKHTLLTAGGHFQCLFSQTALKCMATQLINISWWY